MVSIRRFKKEIGIQKSFLNARKVFKKKRIDTSAISSMINHNYSFIQQSIIVYFYKKNICNYPLNYCINSYKFWRTNNA